MTRKDFKLIAEALLRARPELTEQATFSGMAEVLAWQAAVSNIAGALAETNPRFDRDRFLTAAGFTLD